MAWICICLQCWLVWCVHCQCQWVRFIIFVSLDLCVMQKKPSGKINFVQVPSIDSACLFLSHPHLSHNHLCHIVSHWECYWRRENLPLPNCRFQHLFIVYPYIPTVIYPFIHILIFPSGGWVVRRDVRSHSYITDHIILRQWRKVNR